MQHKTYTLKGNSIAGPVNDFVCGYYQEAYKSPYDGGFLLVYEDYSFLNGNDIMVCLRVDTTKEMQGVIIIEMISGGGSGNIITGELFGSENRKIKHFTGSLLEFCEQQQIKLVAD